MNNEIWKKVNILNGKYEVSNMGRIKSKERIVYRNGGYFTQEEIIKTISKNKNCYSIDGKKIYVSMNRIIFNAF